jgi:Spy/CpxP family protein refolding chaperone
MVYAPLLALACALAGTAAVRAADAGAAEPDAPPQVANAHPKPPARDPAAVFAKRLDLDAKQEAQVRRLLAMRQAQIRRLWSDPSIAADDRVVAIKSINAKTVEQIRSLLTEEQKQKYFQAVPVGPATEPGPSVQDWLHALRPQNPDADAPH